MSDRDTQEIYFKESTPEIRNSISIARDSGATPLTILQYKDMKELIKITEHNGNQAVYARDLHEYLEINTRFDTWINRMFAYGFEEDLDFCTILSESTGGRRSTNYAITLDCAKEISMLQRNEKGKEARRYFIEVEKRAKEMARPKSTLDILKLTIQGLEEQQKELSEVKQDINELKAKTTTRPDYFTVAGYANINNYPVNIKMAAIIGRKASKICKERGYPIDTCPDPRYGVVNVYPTKVLSEVMETQLISK